MAVKAKAEITISRIVDMDKVTRYYLLQSATANAPSKPTTNPPGGSWSVTEPSYISGSTNSLYFVDLTIMSNATFSYSAVSKSSSYEAAKEAWNKANNAQGTANSANNKIDNLEIGGRNLLRNSGKFLIGSSDYSIGQWRLAGNSTMTRSHVDIVDPPYNCSTVTGAYQAIGSHPTTTPDAECIGIDLFPYLGDYDIGTDVIFSAWARVVGGGSNCNFGFSSYMIEFTDGTYLNNYKCVKLNENGTWTRVVVHGKTTSKTGNIYCGFLTGNDIVTVQACAIKIEKSNKVSDWTPAPEDATASVDVEYYLSTSQTSLSGGSWSTTAPAWVNGKYMWSRTVMIDGAGNKTYSPNQNGVCIAGAKGDKGDKGDQGETGKTGPTGPQGPTGAAGKDANQVIHRIDGGGQSTLYKEFATIKITGSYANYPASFKIGGRGYETTDVQICFYSVNNNDPGMQYLRATGGFGVWAYKKTTSTWGLITKINEPYGMVEIFNFRSPSTSVSFTWTTTGLSSLPSGCTGASPLTAATTATNYIKGTTGGLIVGNMANSTLGSNVLIDSDSVDIRNGDSVLASYSARKVELGKNSTDSVIEMCSGIGRITSQAVESDEWTYGINKSLVLESDWLQLTNARAIDLCTNTMNGSNADTEDLCARANIGVTSGKTSNSLHNASFSAESMYNKGGLNAYIRGYTHEMDGAELHMGVTGSVKSTDIYISHSNTSSGGGMVITTPDVVRIRSNAKSSEIEYSVGMSGVNRGVHDTTNDQWMLYCDANDLYYQAPQTSKIKPYYRSGDSVTIEYNGAGIVTSSGTAVIFTVPLTKQVDSGISVSATSIDGFYLRVAGKYTHGSSASTAVKPKSYSAKVVNSGIKVTATFSNTTNVVNNSAIAIDWSGKITFN